MSTGGRRPSGRARGAVAVAAAVLLVATFAPSSSAASEGGAALPPPITLSGVVTDPDGLPVEGAEVQVGVVFESDGSLDLVERLDAVLTDASGSWSSVVTDVPGGWAGEALPITVLALPPPGRALPRTWWDGCITQWWFGDPIPDDDFSAFGPARFASCGPVPLIGPGDSVVRDVQLQPGATLDVTVRGSGGLALEGATVVVGSSYVPDGELVPGRPHDHPTGADGVAHIAGLDVGSQPVWVRSPGYRGSHLEHIPMTYQLPRYSWGPTIELGPTSVEERTVWLSPDCAATDPWPYPDVDPLAVYGWDIGVQEYDGRVVCGEIRWATEAGVATGYGDGTFRPIAPTSRAAIVTWLWRRAGEPAPPPGAPTFTDVSSSSPFRDAISWAAASGITSGYPDGSFRPSAPATTQAVVVMAWRAAGEPGWPHPFGPWRQDPAGTPWDLPVGHPFRSPLRWALSDGLVDPGVASGGAVPGEPLPRGLAAGIVHDLDARLGAAATAGG